MSAAFRVSESPLEPGELERGLVDARAGASVCFEGRVRDHNEGERVTALEYEAHAPVAVKEGRKVVAEALERFDILAAACVHRTGRLEIGDCAVWVGVSAAHRGAAFEACRYIIDEIKARVPIWKKEHYAGGDSGWVNCATRGRAAAGRDTGT